MCTIHVFDETPECTFGFIFDSISNIECPVSPPTEKEDVEKYRSPTFQPSPLGSFSSTEECAVYRIGRHATKPQLVQRCHGRGVCQSHDAHPQLGQGSKSVN